MNRSLEDEVRRRAAGYCEYCRFPERHHVQPFQIEHVISLQHAGPTTIENLALACPHCNLHKGPNVGGIDPVTRQLVRLFNPRTDTWGDHFAWEGPEIAGRTDIGRVTIHVLAMNAPVRARIRAQLIILGFLEG